MTPYSNLIIIREETGPKPDMNPATHGASLHKDKLPTDTKPRPQLVRSSGLFLYIESYLAITMACLRLSDMPFENTPRRPKWVWTPQAYIMSTAPSQDRIIFLGLFVSILLSCQYVRL